MRGSGRTAEKGLEGKSLLYLGLPLKYEVVNRKGIRLRYNETGFNSLTGGTKPGTEARAMRPRLMAGMMHGMGHAGRSHKPVHQNETEEQSPYQSGSFQPDHRSIRLAQ